MPEGGTRMFKGCDFVMVHSGGEAWISHGFVGGVDYGECSRIMKTPWMFFLCRCV